MSKKTVAVIGGGAAGLAAAISAAREGAQVTIFEAGERAGKPILATGNGRCNLTNTRVGSNAYNRPKFVAPVLERYGFQEVKEFFRSLGLCVREESEGRVYPLSNAANTVVDVLLPACRRLDVGFIYKFKASSIKGRAGDFFVQAEDGREVDADAVIVAAGGGSHLLGSCGHELVPFEPVLCSLATDTQQIRGLSGVRVKARVSAYHEDSVKASGAVATDTAASKPFASESGELLFRDYGVSGIVVFDMSRHVKPGDYLSIHMHPATDEVEAVNHLKDRHERLGADYPAGADMTYEDLLRGMFHSRVNAALIKAAGLKPMATVDPEKLGDLAHSCVDFRLQVTGVGDAKNAQVTRGGAQVSQFDSQSMESLQVPGVYAAGETLDVDARCGGFNLHWAWASGIVAGKSAAGRE